VVDGSDNFIHNPVDVPSCTSTLRRSVLMSLGSASSSLIRTSVLKTASFRSGTGALHGTAMSLSSKLKPAARVSGQKKDVW
jgi:hypothetical protein